MNFKRIKWCICSYWCIKQCFCCISPGSSRWILRQSDILQWTSWCWSYIAKSKESFQINYWYYFSSRPYLDRKNVLLNSGSWLHQFSSTYHDVILNRLTNSSSPCRFLYEIKYDWCRSWSCNIDFNWVFILQSRDTFV